VSDPAVVLRAAGAIVAAFLLGALPWALWAGRWKGVDLRTQGSGNIGATNAYRTLGPRLGWTVFALDVGKGAVAVFAAAAIAGPAAPGGPDVWRTVGALSAVLGHVFSPFAGWKGGKGVATALGVMLAVAPRASLLSFAGFVVALLASRRISVGSIFASLVLPVFLWFVPWTRHGVPAACAGSLLALLVLVRHLPNLRRLLAGTEPAFAFRRKPTPPGAPS
jgi:glycerol-3-phosphate acyltransferase PlsY